MILRKPYAFLIKHFKLIHLILVVLSCYSVYRTKIVLDFFNDYVFNMVNVIGQDLKSTLIPTLYPVSAILIIIVTLIVLFVMIIKKKPNIFYIFNVIVYVFVLIIIFSTSSTLETMSRSLVDVRVIRLTRDFMMISFFLQFISIPIVFIRAIGFDVKKFNFKDDLKELEINDEDNEEFEVQISFDRNKTKRNLKKLKREFLYTYKENKALILMVLIISIVSISIYGISNYFYKPVPVGQNTNFYGNGFTMNVLDSYLVNTDYKGNVIDDNYYLLLKIKVKSNNLKKSLDTATTKIVIGNYTYIPLLGYKDKFIDFGNVYQNEKIGDEYEEKILLYRIPKQLVDNQITFVFVNKNSFTTKEGFKSTEVGIKYKDLTGISINNKIPLGKEVEFKDSILDKYKIIINDYEIKDKFKLQYNYCVSNECYLSYEYLTPKINSNYDKTLLRLSGLISNDENVLREYSFAEFVEKYGKICYTIDGVLKTQSLSSNNIINSKNKKNNDIFIELPKEIESASNISIMFTIRDRLYEYILK